jgi:hypothetical protein
VNVLCGVSDGRGKVCGRRIQHFGGTDPLNPEGPYLIGHCTKHGLLAITRDQFDRAEATGQKAVHLVRGPHTRAMLERVSDIARRLPDL